MFEDLDYAIAPGPELATLLAGVDLSAAFDCDLIDVIMAAERLAAWVASVQLEAMAEFGRRRPVIGVHSGQLLDEFAEDEIAAALSVARTTAADRIGLGMDLRRRLPATHAALRAGELTPYKARLISEGTADLDSTEVATAEAHLLRSAQGQTPGQLRAAIARAVLTADPDATAKRHAIAKAERRIVKYPERDGMATLWALLPADDAATIYHGLTAVAHDAATADDSRTLDARRVDTLVDLIRHTLDADTAAPGTNTSGAITSGTATSGKAASRRRATRPLVHVTVPASTLLGLDNLPAHLTGHGPIPADLARHIALDADWRRILTDPHDGTVLDVGTTRYQPPASLRRHVTTRDHTCRFPGCRQPADRCDLDHCTPFPQGPTAAHNLHALCRHHHRLKHTARWQAKRRIPHPDTGLPPSLRWTSPTGHTYDTHAPPAVPR
jgi:hypothetical protein